MIRAGAISPTGKRAVIEARGEIFTVPAEKGDLRNLTNTSGSAERSPTWSPDGLRLAWFSDESGEYQLVIADQLGKVEKQIEIPGATFFYTPQWSPDSNHIAFGDADRTLWVVDVASGKIDRIDNEGFVHPLRRINPEWSPDSKWIAYSRELKNQYYAVFVYSMEGGDTRQITDGLSNSHSPAWDEGGEYLYFLGSTDYGLGVAWLDMSSLGRTANYSIYLAVLDSELESPLKPESDEEAAADEADESKDEDSEEEDKADDVPAVKIDFEGIGQRIIAINVPPRPYDQLKAGEKGIVFYSERIPHQDGTTVHRYSLEDRESKQLLTEVAGFAISADGKKLLYAKAESAWFIVDADKPPENGKGQLDLEAMRTKVNSQAEWSQIFAEAVRYQRDYFYVENIHGLDLDWVKETYGPLVRHVRHRSDLTYILDLVGAETSVGHSFTGGGDLPDVDTVPVGLLGADLVAHGGRYRIDKIYSGENWNPDLRAPLRGPGINIEDGSYLIAVNGKSLTDNMNPYSLFDRTADRQTVLTLSQRPDGRDPEDVTVVPVASEVNLRQREWMDTNRRKVDELSGGRLAYVWIPNTTDAGFTSFNRYYFAQQDKQGAIIDERFNHGGQIADYIVDLLARDLYGFFNNPVGDQQPLTAPNAAIWGPKVMLINEMSGSGGDMLPYMFRARGIGPLVGTRTWGGLVGIWDVPPLIDGGYITAPRGGFYDLEGNWAVENVGIAPDIEVEQEPGLMTDGGDPQLERAVEEALRMLETQAVPILPQPEDPVRVRRPE
jgi:tricorn protease